MSAWRREAIAALPEYRPLIDRSGSPMALWIELHLAFEDAVAAGEQGRVRRILGYAAWCFSDRSGPLPNDASTAVVCAFYEHLATRRDRWPMFRRWFDPAMFHRLRPCFAYHLGEPELAELTRLYGKTTAPR